ncbi:titin homolog [Nasonia vitripennis]|uniref:RIIa domain-containing protein n=1 Tax=Nasonia vitripennis TaxID=7425 RepID=A0A7M7QWK3_NASVI|nr:titin homolog [Nasonia vitripennis]XP_032455609.1 titin homolog [Nasonia vitripennis]XP_032455610.1 titin homolog [Nasonia vitripennis]
MTAIMYDSKPNNHIFLTPRVPQGLAAAVEGLTREVIRHRPENIYIFAAHHFEKLLRLREQYDDTPVNKNNMKILHDMNETIKERHIYLESKDTNNYVQHSGWSLNETAKVLERHRSIFGESNQKITTEEVRELANEKISPTSKIPVTSPKKSKERWSGIENKNITSKYAAASSSRRRESPRVGTQDWHSTSNKHDSKTTPKIISQIPLAKDIKTELKKNRMSSRERKKSEEKKIQVACEYSKETIIEKTSRRSVEKTKRNYETRTEQRKTSRTEDTTKKRTETTDSPKLKKSSRSVSMDHVKNYVVQNFVGMTSLDELQTPSYVEKVQEVIDETSMIIKEKVEALKTGVVKASRSKHSKKDRSASSDEHSKTSTKSTESDKQSPKNVDNDKSESKNSDNSEGSNESKISLPAVRPPSSKSTSRSLSARSDSDGLVLPPISPEFTKSEKVKEELVLPVLSPPRSTTTSPDVPVNPVVTVEKPADTKDEKNAKDAKDANHEEEFQDSLNVTPEPRDPDQRPDSLETSEVVDKSDSSGHVSPLETLKDKLLEIEEVQKRIEGVLDDTKTTDEKANDDAGIALNIQDKLLKIHESEKRIEKILDSQSADADERKTDIERKLKELEDAEKRIENIFVSESDRESSNKTDVMVVEQKDNAILTTKKIEKEGDNGHEKESRSASNSGKSTQSIKEEKTIPTSAVDTRVLSPHSYILTEGSPYDIPDSVTTVIIPDRNPSPDSDTLNIEIENDKIYTTLLSSKELKEVQADDFSAETSEDQTSSIHDAFGEPVEDTENVETSTVDVELMRGIKASHDIIVSRQDLDLIQEERDKEEAIDSEDEKVLKVVTSSLEEILDKSEVEYVSKEEIQSVVKNVQKEEPEESSPEAAKTGEYVSTTDETKESSADDNLVETAEVVENSLDIEEITARSGESSNELKETSALTDRSSLSFDPAVPIVPELNLDSLPDLTISSFNITDDEQKINQTESKKSSSSEATLSLTDGTKELSSDDKKSLGDKEMTNLEKNEEQTRQLDDSGKQENREAMEEAANDSTEKLESTSQVVTDDVAEKLETEEYEKLEKILISSVAAEDKKQASENTHQSEKIGLDEAASEWKARIVNHTGDDEGVPDDINKFVCDDESGENKQTIQQQSAHQSDNAESSSRVDIVENEQQLPVESSSQCTDKLDDLSIKTNADEVASQIDNQSLDTSSKPEEEEEEKEEKVDAEKSSGDVATKEETSDEKKHCSIYVPETSKDLSTESTESSTFMSAATKIQAGVRGFLTRRRLQSTQRRSSTLDSVPSIQESFAVENSTPAEIRSIPSTTHLIPIVESASSISDARSRKKLRREDAVQRTTLSVENAFAENQLQHTGEFHDCIPLPVLDAAGVLALKLARQQQQQQQSDRSDNGDVSVVEEVKDKTKDDEAKNVEQLLGKILMEHATIPGPTAKLGPFVDVVLLPGDTEAMLQNSYLNFITSVEDVANELFPDPLMRTGTPKGVIIEEITSLDDIKSVGPPTESVSSEIETESKKDESSSKEAPAQNTESSEIKPSVEPGKAVAVEEPAKTKPEAQEKEEVSISTSEEPLSMNIDEVLGLGDEDENSRKPVRAMTKLASAELIPRTSSLSQESHLSDERTKSPVTMMQIAPGASVEEKSEDKSTDLTAKEGSSTEEKEQESPNTQKKSNDTA